MKKVILMAMVFVLAISGLSLAEQRGFGFDMKRGGMLMPPGPWWELPKLSESLSIIDEEKVKLENLFYEHRKGMIDLRGEAQKARLELEQLMRSDTFTSEAGKAGFKRLQDAQNMLAAERFSYVVAVRELLGAERYRKLRAEIRKFRREVRQGRRMAYKQGMDGN